jgi:hypothetical protein
VWVQPELPAEGGLGGRDVAELFADREAELEDLARIGAEAEDGRLKVELGVDPASVDGD